jgi:large subunit ribosomal protein L23
MAAKKNILVKPLITEKSENISENENRYSFVVDRRANKIEIKKAVEDMFNVAVVSVNTSVMPSKAVSRNTKSGVIRGRKSGYKKAVVRLAEGDIIDFYGDL